jgi:hypothetical protein
LQLISLNAARFDWDLDFWDFALTLLRRPLDLVPEDDFTGQQLGLVSGGGFFDLARAGFDLV